MVRHAGRDSSDGADAAAADGAPTLVRVDGVADAASAQAWLADNRERVLTELRRHGSLMIRGLPLASPEHFAAARDVLLEDHLEVPREETTPRTGYGNGIFSATDLPPVQRIRLHCEDSYSVVFPGILLFCCLVPPERGGATTLGDTRRVLAALPADLVERFRRRGWMIVRNFQKHVGMPWQQAFGTADRAAVESYCDQNQLSYEWLPDDRLRTSGVRSATVRHPSTGEESWFNHVAVFNEWTHDPETREILVAACGPDGLPQNTYYGDGSPIDPADVAVINRAFDEVMVRESWRRGDLVLVDNLLCSHGREPFTGDRRVLVAMGEPRRMADCSPSGPIGPAAARGPGKEGWT
ncbi:TauD/TfdA family dioxygenase [Actinomadura citrea]|uniref:TauD/TfdA family dioxygenase n=1 Tax=Actinomadura citrea TaxID=46158 RepID=UPI0015CD740B|nr:TauD/TfdA family dioxygenase [Actinomadura citrea]GGT76121.1 protein AmbC [Actinomadura citrea]